MDAQTFGVVQNNVVNVFVSDDNVLDVLCSGQKSPDGDGTPARRKLPPGGRLPPLNHKPNGVTRVRQDEEMYNDDDDDDDDDDDEDDEDRNAKGRPRSAAGARKLPPLALNDFGAKDIRKKKGQTTTTTMAVNYLEIREDKKK